VSNVYSNQGTSIQPNQGQVLSDLSKLEKDLMARRSGLTEPGDIQMIEEQLMTIKVAQEATLDQVNESRLRAGIERDAETESIPGAALARGEKFESYNGHGNNYINYMKSNIAGLAQLISKN
jgi:hypothetical protein